MLGFFINRKYTYVNGKLLLLVVIAVGIAISTRLGIAYYDEIQQTQQVNLELTVYEQQIKQEQAKIEAIKKDVATLSEKYSEASEQANKEEDLFNQLYNNYINEISFYSKYACLTPVSGQGIDIGIDDSQITDKADTYLVHDEYLAEIINVLKCAGAQAIAINGQRVTANTECLCLGPGIRVNGVRLFAPYHIEAIGISDTLAKTFTDSNIYKTLKKNKLIVDVVKKQNVIIDKYRNNISNNVTELNVIE